MLMIDFDYHSRSKIQEAEELIKKHYPFESFKTYFDWENLLLTDYRETECYSTIAILKSYNGNILVFTNCNCGYGGYGPNNTVELLLLLGIARIDAEKYVFANNAVELYFNKDGCVIDKKTNLINTFESRMDNCPLGKINLNMVDFIDAKERTMYLIEPTGDKLFALMQLLQVMCPVNLSYYIGDDNSEYIDFSFEDLILPRQKRVRKDHAFISIKGSAFNTVCFFKRERAKSSINNITAALNLRPPFMEVSLGGLSCLIPPKTIQSKFDKVRVILNEFFNPHEGYAQQSIEQRQDGRPSIQ